MRALINTATPNAFHLDAARRIKARRVQIIDDDVSLALAFAFLRCIRVKGPHFLPYMLRERAAFLLQNKWSQHSNTIFHCIHAKNNWFI